MPHGSALGGLIKAGRHASVAHLLRAIVVGALPVGLLAGVLNNRPVLGREDCPDTGLMAVGAVRAAVTPAVVRGKARPFLRGLVLSGWGAALAGLVLCGWHPAVMARPVVDPGNEVEPPFPDDESPSPVPADRPASLVVRGLIMAAPQLSLARAGGLLARGIARRGRGAAAGEDFRHHG